MVMLQCMDFDPAEANIGVNCDEASISMSKCRGNGFVVATWAVGGAVSVTNEITSYV